MPKKLLQRKVDTRFLSRLWPPLKKRGHLYQREEIVFEYSKKYVSPTNQFGVGDELGTVVDPEYGSKLLVRFFGEDHDEEMGKNDVAPASFGKLFPDSCASGGGIKWRFQRMCAGGGLVTKEMNSNDEGDDEGDDEGNHEGNGKGDDKSNAKGGLVTKEMNSNDEGDDEGDDEGNDKGDDEGCLLYTSPSPRDYAASRMPSSA